MLQYHDYYHYVAGSHLASRLLALCLCVTPYISMLYVGSIYGRPLLMIFPLVQPDASSSLSRVVPVGTLLLHQLIQDALRGVPIVVLAELLLHLFVPCKSRRVRVEDIANHLLEVLGIAYRPTCSCSNLMDGGEGNRASASDEHFTQEHLMRSTGLLV